MRIALLVATILCSLALIALSTDQFLAAYFGARSLKSAQAGNTRKAVSNIDRAIALNPLVATYRTVRASYYVSLAKPEVTYAEVKAMVAVNPYYFRHQVRAGQMLNNDDAEAHYLRAVELVPNSAKLREQVAGFYLDIGEPWAALQQLDIAIELVGDSTWAFHSHYLAGLAYLQLGEPWRAEQELRTSIEQSDNRSTCQKALLILIEMVPNYAGETCRETG